MMPLTNSEIAARKTPEQRAAERGQRAQVSQSTNLLQSHSLVWWGNAAEIRDDANQGTVICAGTLAEMIAEAKRRGLYPGQA